MMTKRKEILALFSSLFSPFFVGEERVLGVEKGGTIQLREGWGDSGW